MVRPASILLVSTLLVAAACGTPKQDTPIREEPIAARPAEPSATPPPGKDMADAAAPEEPTEPEDEFSAYDPRVAQAARVAVKIQADPSKVETVLASADLDREKLDALMYEIASNPELTQQYRIARGMAVAPDLTPTDEDAPAEDAPAEEEAP